MTKLDKYKGVFPAFYACYDDEGNVSPERVEALAKHYLDVGVRGLYIGGSSGECIYQTVEERKLVLEHVMKAVGGKMTVIAHIAAPSTAASVELAKHAEEQGVDALAAIPPIYYGLSETAIEKYWTDIVMATDKDFFIYNVPSTTGYSLSPKLYKKMLELPQVIGVKNSSAVVQDVYLLRQAETKDAIMFYGVDEQYISGRILGADGGIGSTYGVMPRLFMRIEEAFKNNEVTIAQELQFAINEVIFKILGCEGSLYGVMKEVIKINEGISAGSVRQPLPKVTDSYHKEIEEIAKLIKKYEQKFCK